jgi:D-lactate dehydrogenase (cytochrome)
LAVAAAAAISGWGISSLVSLRGRDAAKSKKKGKRSHHTDDDERDDEKTEGRKNEAVSLVDNDDAEVGFANRNEMQEVS